MNKSNIAKAATIGTGEGQHGSSVQDQDINERGRRLVVLMGGGSVAMLLVAGGLLWWRDGERLFTEGLISAIARCF